jgi:hypothetical protein
VTTELNTPASARDSLHLAAIDAWQAIASGRPVPRIDPVELHQGMHDALRTSDGTHLLDQLYLRWEEIAQQHGFTVNDGSGDILPELNEAVTDLITAAIWFGVTTGHHAIAGGVHFVPSKFAGWA